MVGSYNNEIYLYDIKILCKGEPNISKECFGMLGWKLIKIKVDQCWRRFKESFHMVEVTKLPCNSKFLGIQNQ